MPLFPDIDLENYLRRMVNFPEVNEGDNERQAQLANASLQAEKANPKTAEDDKKEPETKPEEGKEETEDE